MARYLGKHTIGIDMRTGKKVRYADLVEDGENRGILTTREERDAEHPQKFARRVPLDRLTIRRPSPEPMIGAVTVIGNSGGSSDLWEGNQTALHLALIMGEVVVTPSAENRPGSQIAPVVTGTPREGETLTTSDGTWSNSPTAYAYQWYRNGTEIPGETANTYDLVFADVGTLITAIVTASNSGGSAAQTSNAVGPILQALPVNTVLPVITGTPQVGETLSVDTGTWTNTPILSYAYQWTSDGANIPGATSSSYLVTTEFAGTELRAVVTATNSGGSASATAAFFAALVKKASDQTSANYTAGVAVAWDTETTDTASVHDTGSNTTRLTVPSDTSYVRLSAGIHISSVNTNTRAYAYFTKDGAAHGSFVGAGTISKYGSATEHFLNIVSPPVAVTAGQYFEVVLLCADTSITVEDHSWFAMERVG